MNRAAPPVRLAFLLVPQFSMMSFAAALEPLRSANRLAGRNLYEWQLASVDGRPVEASSGIRIAVATSLAEIARPDMLVVCASLEPEQYARERRVLPVLRRLARHGCRVGGLSGGAFLLAEAGLLADRTATVHWEFASLFRLRHPGIRLVPDLYVVDRDVFTCSGGTAALDLMLYFVREDGGPVLAHAVAEQFLHARIRGQGDGQRMDVHARYGLHDARLAGIVAAMEHSLSEPVPVAELARRGEMSTRQVERLFRANLGTTPKRFYLQLRLDRARTLVVQDALTLRDIALECGFGSTAHFTNAYRRRFRTTPAADRRAATRVPELASRLPGR